MDSTTVSDAILEAERIGVLLYVLFVVVAVVIIALGAVASNDPFSALTAGMSFVSGIVVLGIIVYLETRVWDRD